MSDTSDPPSKPQTLTLQQALDLAVEHHRGGDVPRAESIYNQILKADPNQPQALHLLGVIAFQGGNNEKAVELIEKALSIHPEFAEAYCNLGIAQNKLGKFDKALICYKRAIALKPNYAEAQSHLGLGIQTLGRVDEAVVHFRKALALKPDSAEAHNNLGNALKELGQSEEAVASYETALKLNPNYAEANNNLGNIYYDLGQFEEASRSYRKALSIKPDYAMARNNLGLALVQLDRLEEAAECFEQADNDNSRPNLLECAYSLGQKDRFYHLLEKITLEDKTNRGVAAISAFASHQFDRRDPYPFCTAPLDFVHVNNIASITGEGEELLPDLNKQIADVEIDGRHQTLLESGVQSSGNLFLECQGALAELDKIIRKGFDSGLGKSLLNGTTFIELNQLKV